MKNWTKILIAVLSLVMVLSLVGCPGDKPEETPAESTPTETPAESTPEETPAASTPEETPAASTPEETPEPSTPEETDPPAPPATVIPIEDALEGFVTEAEEGLLDAKIVVKTGFAGTAAWTGTDLEGYVIKSGNAGEASTKSALKFDIAVSADTLLKFSLKVDAAEGDVFYVILDKDRVGSGDYVAGEYNVSVLVPTGTHTVTFIYEKDGSGDEGTDAAYISKITAEKSLFSATPVTLLQSLEKPVNFDWDNATTIEVEDAATVLQGATKSTIADRNFIYIKKSHAYPKVVVPFTIAEEGTYDFIFSVCAKSRAEGIISNGLVQIDDGGMYYTGSEHLDRNGVLEYFMGVTATLTAGEHTITFYLAPDFDDSSVKSIYYDQIIYSKAMFAVDGVKGEDEYANATEVTVGDAWSNNPADYSGTGAKAWVTNTANGVLIYAEVDDATPTDDTDGNGDNGDKFQIYVDMVRDYAASGLTAGDYKGTGKAGTKRLGWVNVTPDGKIWGGWGFGGVDTLACKVNKSETSYTLEMFIPWNVDTLPEDGMIGLALCFHDDTNADQTRDAIFFQTGGTDYWNSYEALPTYTIVK